MDKKEQKKSRRKRLTRTDMLVFAAGAVIFGSLSVTLYHFRPEEKNENSILQQAWKSLPTLFTESESEIEHAFTMVIDETAVAWYFIHDEEGNHYIPVECYVSKIGDFEFVAVHESSEIIEDIPYMQLGNGQVVLINNPDCSELYYIDYTGEICHEKLDETGYPYVIYTLNLEECIFLDRNAQKIDVFSEKP